MKISILGMDPSMTNWGMASSVLDLVEGTMEDPVLALVSPKKAEGKQVRVNSSDLHVAHQLGELVIPMALKAKVVFVEIPVGSQSARAMCGYGMCLGILGTLRQMGVQLIEVTATEVKKALSGDRSASKEKMIQAGLEQYPNINWPRQTRDGKGFSKGDVHSKAEHCADAIGAIHAGVNTPAFQQLLKLYQKE